MTTINITLVGAGTIGLSFASLHLYQNPSVNITIYDVRPDLKSYIAANLPTYLSSFPSAAPYSIYAPRLHIAKTLQEAISTAHIIQEQGPENPTWKKSTWAEVEKYASKDALFWSSTSGIPASIQAGEMQDKTRVVVVHPYNPPHIMPLLEIVPSPSTAGDVVTRTLEYWRGLGRTPVVVKKECAGFVANRLALAFYREAVALVNEGVVDVADVDDVVTSSMGPRWAVQGPFMSYHAGGGAGGLRALMGNIGGTVRDAWRESDGVKVGPEIFEDGGLEKIYEETERVYGRIDTAETGRKTREVLGVTRGEAESKK